MLLFALAPLLSPNYRALSEPRPNAYGGDFLADWIGGFIVRKGDREKLYDIAYAHELEHDLELVGFSWDESKYLRILYPPGYYVLVAPWSFLPAPMAAVLSYFLMVSFFLAAVAIWHRAHPQPVTLQGMLLAGVLYGPLWHSLLGGQKGTLWLLLFTSTFVLLERNRPFSAGLVFGLAALKPPLTLVVGIWMLLRGQWRFVLGCLTAGLFLVGLSLLVGWEACRGFVRMGVELRDVALSPDYPIERVQSWHGLFAMCLRERAAPEVTRWLTALADLLTLACLACLLRKPLRFGDDLFAVQFAGAVLATVLIAPHLLTYDLTLVLLPFVLVARLRHRMLTRMLVLAFTSCVVSETVAQVTQFPLSTPVLFVLLTVLVLLEAETPRTMNPAPSFATGTIPS